MVLGDLNGDRKNDFKDFRLFQADFMDGNGEAASPTAGAMPEPSVALGPVGCDLRFAIKEAIAHRRRGERTSPSFRRRISIDDYPSVLAAPCRS